MAWIRVGDGQTVNKASRILLDNLSSKQDQEGWKRNEVDIRVNELNKSISLLHYNLNMYDAYGIFLGEIGVLPMIGP